MRLTIGLAAAALLLAGCTAAPAPQQVAATPTPTGPGTFNGTVLIRFGTAGHGVSNDLQVGDDCVMGSPGGYSDLQPGSQAVLTDNAGTTVAISEVSKTVVSEATEYVWPYQCESRIEFRDVPDTAPSYRLVIGRRPPHDVTRSDLAGTLLLTLS